MSSEEDSEDNLIETRRLLENKPKGKDRVYLKRSSSCQILYASKSQLFEMAREQEQQVPLNVDPPMVSQHEIKVINNYFSVGIDSKIALDFHKLRNSNPALFQSKFINYMWYGGIGFKNFFLTAVDLSEVLTLEIDGEEKKLDKIKMEALVFLNIPSIYGGTNLWEDNTKSSTNKRNQCNQKINDRKIEVFGIKNATHLALLQTPGQVGTGGGKFLGAGDSIRVTLTQSLPAQIDGEPFILEKCIFTITPFNQAKLVYNINNSKNKKNALLV